ncbi:MAG: S8 family serine peptidase [Caldilineaceae bacterium]|nr:S8 family serine peptidase [Caldilineaceae bacterium]
MATYSRLFLLMAVPLLLLASLFPPSNALATAARVEPRDKIDPKLMQVLQSAATGEMISVIVELREKESLSDLKEKQRKNQIKKIIERLKKKAQQTQSKVIQLVESRIADGTAQSYTSFWMINGLEVTATPAVIQELAQLNAVGKIVRNESIAAPATPLNSRTSLVRQGGAPEANIALVNAPALWSQGYQGQGIVVANMDSGVDISHPELSARYRGGANSWFDPYGQHATPYDASGHGTWTMGIMVGGNGGGTSIGMAPGAQWIAAKIFNDQGSGTVAGIHAAFQWLLDPDGNPATADTPNVVNGSWTFQSPGCNLEFEDDIAVLRAAGVLPIFAAGNAGPSANTSYSPANNPSAFAVGAVNNNNQIYAYSSRGPATCGGPTITFPHMSAPGVNVLTTDRYGLYFPQTGTSLAAPHVAGALALLLNAYPSASAARQQAALLNSSVDLGAAGADNNFGQGRLDVLAAYNWLANNSNNQDPTVNAGVDVTVTLAAGVNLLGTASDDGLPTPAHLMTTWTLQSGPGAVTFANANALQTSATFTVEGLYTLRLTANDGQLTVSDTILVTVLAGAPVNQPPTVNAGADQSITLPAAANLMGSASDDGLPTPANLVATWSVVSGPGTVTFGNANALNTTASFTGAGVYTLRLTASDGALATSDDLVITVNPAPPVNQPPTVNAGADQSITLPAAANLTGSASDDGLPTPANLVATWSAVSGPGAVTFGSANALNTTASFTGAGVYTLRLTANDGALATSDDVVITVNPAASTGNVLYLSSSANGTVGGVAFRDEDILAYDPNTDRWSLAFDGSDVGLGGVDVDALAVLSDGSLLLSTDNPVTLSGVGSVDDSDIVHFMPSSLGDNTAGSYALYFRGADVGLTTSGEDIDAIDFAPDGRLLISTLNSASVPGVSANDEDILAFAPTALGAPTKGSWSLYFDGSTAELTASTEEIWGLSVGASGKLYLSMAGAFAVTGVSGTAADIFTCTPITLGANNTSCVYAPYWNGAAHGFGKQIIDGMNIGGVLSAGGATAAALADAAAEGPALEANDDDDPTNGNFEVDTDGDAENRASHQLFLPVVQR